MILKSILIWVLMIPFAILNGGLREFVLNNLLGRKLALPLSGVLLSLIIFLIAYLFVSKLKITESKSCCIIGLIWMSLTLIFEFTMNIWSGMSLSDMLAVYNPMTGNLWILVISTTVISPLLAVKIQMKKRTKKV